MASGLEPDAVVQLLNEIYLVMDYCASLFPIFKVETIGDAYMIVGGIGNNDEFEDKNAALTNAMNICDFAVCVREAVKQVKSPIDGTPITLRIGINTGAVVAGVAGSLMPRYCLFGNTVNIAHRMESTGEPNQIQVSEATANILKSSEQELYNMTAREPISIKGLDHKMSNYWIDTMSESHAAERDDIMKNIIQVSTQIVSDFDTTPNNVGKFPHLIMPTLKRNGAFTKLIRSNSNQSLHSMTSGDVPTGLTSESDMKRIFQDAENCSVMSGPTEASEWNDNIPVKALIICGLSKMRLSVVKLLIEVFGDSICFNYAESIKQAMENALTSVHNYNLVLVDEMTGPVNDIMALLVWLKVELNVPTAINFNSKRIPSMRDGQKYVDFFWGMKLPTKEEITFSFLRSTNPFAVMLITQPHNSEPVEKTSTLKILIIVRNLSKSKIIGKQVQSSLAKFKCPLDIMVTNSGTDAIEKIYDSNYVHMVMVDNALGASVGDVTFSEVLFHLQRSKSTKDSISVGLTTSANVNSDNLIKIGCDLVWSLPLPSSDILSLRMKKFFSYMST